MDLAIGITVGASTQVALLVAPILVFAGFFLGQDMNLLFTRYEMWAVVLAVFITRTPDLRRRIDLARGTDADRDLLHARHRLFPPAARGGQRVLALGQDINQCFASSCTFFVVVFVNEFLAGARPAPGEEKDAQSAYEPRSGPGAGQKYLVTFVGDWEVTKTFYPRTGDPVKTKGECRQTMIHDGRFLQSEFTFEQDGNKTTGLGLVGFDTATSGQFTTVWTDSRSTRMSLRQSQEPFNGKEIVLQSRSIEKDARGRPQVAHRSRGWKRNGDRIIHRQYTIGAEGQERLIMELNMTRKRKPASAGQ